MRIKKKKKKEGKKSKTKKKWKTREPRPTPSASGSLSVFLCVFWASSDAPGNNSVRDTGSGPSSSWRVCGFHFVQCCRPASPPWHRPPFRNIRNLSCKRGAAAVMQSQFPNAAGLSFPDMSGFSVTSVVCDAGHNPVCIPTQRKKTYLGGNLRSI